MSQFLSYQRNISKSEDNQSILVQIFPFSRSSIVCSCLKLEVLPGSSASLGGKAGSAECEALERPEHPWFAFPSEDAVRDSNVQKIPY